MFLMRMTLMIFMMELQSTIQIFITKIYSLCLERSSGRRLYSNMLS
ncbi:hypothetical protein LINPERHAP2_LOCUS14320 [Linum perenne]